MRLVILLTGDPGCGMTTLIQRVLADLSLPVGGFYTQEVREGRTRKGFEIITLDGRRATSLTSISVVPRRPASIE